MKLQCYIAFSSFSLHPSSFIKRFLVKIHQFDSRHCGFEPLITLLGARPIDGLLECVRGDDAIYHRHARLHARLSDALRNFAGDIFKVRRLSANDGAQTDHGIELSGFCDLQRQQWNLERARNLVELDRILISAQTIESVERALNQSRSNEIIPAAGDEREAKTFGVQASLMGNCLQALRIGSCRGLSPGLSQYR